MADAFPVSVLTTPELDERLVSEIRSIVWAAFEEHGRGGFTEDDWRHALGGMHFLLEVPSGVVGHAAVVERQLVVGRRPIRAGYVEAVAVDPGHQRKGLGTILMRAVNAYVEAQFELGALGTGTHAFYERLGWQTWQGPSGVRTSTGLEATPDEDGYILVLQTPSSPPLRLTDPISCDWRPGDVW